MKMAKATERDIDAAGDAMSVLQDISSGYYAKRDGDECDDFRFDPEDPAHLRKFYDLMNATLDASPGWPGRVIGGMCYVILFDENQIVDPHAETLELHPRFAAAAGAVDGEAEYQSWAPSGAPALPPYPDSVLLDFIASEYLDVSAFAMPTGGDDADVGWKLHQEHMGAKGRVEVACHYRDDLRAAIRDAMQALGYSVPTGVGGNDGR